MCVCVYVCVCVCVEGKPRGYRGSHFPGPAAAALTPRPSPWDSMLTLDGQGDALTRAKAHASCSRERPDEALCQAAGADTGTEGWGEEAAGRVRECNPAALLPSTQRDENPGIRTNTTVCLGRIAKHLSPGAREKMLAPAFLRVRGPCRRAARERSSPSFRPPLPMVLSFFFVFFIGPSAPRFIAGNAGLVSARAPGGHLRHVRHGRVLPAQGLRGEAPAQRRPSHA